jgi:hypothetical protein
MKEFEIEVLRNNNFDFVLPFNIVSGEVLFKTEGYLPLERSPKESLFEMLYSISEAKILAANHLLSSENILLSVNKEYYINNFSIEKIFEIIYQVSDKKEQIPMRKIIKRIEEENPSLRQILKIIKETEKEWGVICYNN